jgi:hypothetical protein
VDAIEIRCAAAATISPEPIAMQQRAIDPQGSYSSIPGVDPYIDWAFGAGSAFFVLSEKGQEWLPVLLQLSGISAREFADVVRKRFADARDAVIRISELYSDPPAGLEASSYCTALVTRKFFEILRDDDALKKQVAGVALGPPLSPEARRGSRSNAS